MDRVFEYRHNQACSRGLQPAFGFRIMLYPRLSKRGSKPTTTKRDFSSMKDNVFAPCRSTPYKFGAGVTDEIGGGTTSSPSV